MIKMGSGFLVLCPKNKSILLVLRNDSTPTWANLGGLVEQYETPLQCAKRELLEESGFIENSDYRIVSSDPLHIYKNNTFNYYSYLAIMDEEKSPVLNYENKQFVWASLNSLPSPLHFGLDEILQNPKATKKIKKLLI